jgi:hypothetical protein
MPRPPDPKPPIEGWRVRPFQFSEAEAESLAALVDVPKRERWLIRETADLLGQVEDWKRSEELDRPQNGSSPKSVTAV